MPRYVFQTRQGEHSKPSITSDCPDHAAAQRGRRNARRYGARHCRRTAIKSQMANRGRRRNREANLPALRSCRASGVRRPQLAASFVRRHPANRAALRSGATARLRDQRVGIPHAFGRLVARPQARLTTKHDQAGSSSLISGLSCRTEFSSDW
jgi:hypothetical protein